jgi:hypothetical protein
MSVARIRDCAEYWRHVATFPTHRVCTRRDLDDARILLNRTRDGSTRK